MREVQARSVGEIRRFVEQSIAHRVAAPFRNYEHAELSLLPTGVDGLSLPIGALTQVCGAGKTSLLQSTLANASLRGMSMALIDAGDAFDPESAESAGVELARVLWVRCGDSSIRGRIAIAAMERAFKATDMLLNGGGFGVIAVDLSDVDEQSMRKVPLTSWFRLSRVIERMETALVFMMPALMPGYAALSIETSVVTNVWEEAIEGASVAHGRLLKRRCIAARVIGEKKPVRRVRVEAVRHEFDVRTRWA